MICFNFGSKHTFVGIRLAMAIPKSTHNVCFGSKIIKIGIPLQTPVLLYKSGVSGGKHSRTCFHDGPGGKRCIPGQTRF